MPITYQDLLQSLSSSKAAREHCSDSHAHTAQSSHANRMKPSAAYASIHRTCCCRASAMRGALTRGSGASRTALSGSGSSTSGSRAGAASAEVHCASPVSGRRAVLGVTAGLLGCFTAWLTGGGWLNGRGECWPCMSIWDQHCFKHMQHPVPAQQVLSGSHMKPMHCAARRWCMLDDVDAARGITQAPWGPHLTRRQAHVLQPVQH